MSVLLDLKTFFDTINGLGLITLGSMPATPDIVGTIYEYGGNAIERRFGIDGVGYEHPSCQIAFRGVPGDYLGPRTRAGIALFALATIPMGSGILGVTLYPKIDPKQSPFSIRPVDNNNRYSIGFNFDIMKEPS